MTRARVTVSIRRDGAFEIYLNEAGRDLLVQRLQSLDQENDHLHLDYCPDPDDAPTDILLSRIPYRDDDRCLEIGKILFRPDDWDREYFPHVLGDLNSP